MKCKEVEIHAIAYLDGKLAARQREAVELHLEGCSACAERLRGFSQVNHLLDGWEGIQPSASFAARFEQRLLAPPGASASWWDRFPRRLAQVPLGNPVLAGAMLAVIVLAVVLIGYSPTSPETVAQHTTPPIVATLAEGADDLALYRDLPVLEDWELLSNFEVLQELNEMTP